MKIKTSELSGVALDWAVAVAEHGKVHVYPDGGFCPPEDTVSMNDDDGSLWVNSGIGPHPKDSWSPSTDWSQGGPLIERFKVGVIPINVGILNGARSEWFATAFLNGDNAESCCKGMGESSLVAACRAIVGLALGDEVDVPEGLV